MAKMWSLLRGKDQPEQRFGLDELQAAYNRAGLGGGMLNTRGVAGQSSETIENDFVGYIEGAYKSNGPIFAVCLLRQLVFSEMRFAYQIMVEGRPQDLEFKKELSILEHPWPNGTTGELLSRAIQDTDLSGNHYVVREGVGDKARLRRLRPDWVDVLLTAPPDEAVRSDVAGYLYRPGGTHNKDLWEIYPIDGSNGHVAHWTPIPDPEAQYRGMSWMTPILREIISDKQATKHKLKFWENAAQPNLAVSFKENVTPEQFKEFMDTMDEQKHGIDHAYETLYLGGGADVTVVGSDLRQMDFKSVQGLSETRIAAAARVHPVLVGFSEGLQGSTLNEGNFKSAKNAFSDGVLRPLWRSLCAAYEPLVAEFADRRLWFDSRDVGFFREDRREMSQIRSLDTTAMSRLIMNGFDPDSVVLAIEKEDWTLLEHTGLVSVQLLPPGTTGDGQVPGAAGSDDEKKPASDKKDAKQAEGQQAQSGSKGVQGSGGSKGEPGKPGKNGAKGTSGKPGTKGTSGHRDSDLMREALIRDVFDEPELEE